MRYVLSFFFFFFNDTATTEIYTLSLHDALPISLTEKAASHVQSFLAKRGKGVGLRVGVRTTGCSGLAYKLRSEEHTSELQSHSDLVCRLLLEKKKKTNNPRGRALQR